jgi:hypothetical protein
MTRVTHTHHIQSQDLTAPVSMSMRSGQEG